jgi:3-oxoacyl-[acyl-carrier protein] reductase
VIVTGAASGIGRACAAGLLAAGDRVCGVDLNAIPTDTFAPDRLADFLAVSADVADGDACRKAVAATVARFRRADRPDPYGGRPFHPDLAGVERRAFQPDHGGERDRRVPDGAGRRPAHGAQQRDRAGELRLDQRRRRRRPWRGGPAYVASKAAVIGLTRALARSLAPSGIRVNAVSPGSTDTAMIADYDQEARRKVAEHALIGRGFAQGGPVLLAAKIDDAPGVGQTPRDPALIRHRFMQGLGTGRQSALDG